MSNELIVCSDAIFKQCSKCGEIKPIYLYSKNRSKSSGYDIYCKFCCISKSKQTRQNNPIYFKEYYIKHQILKRKAIKEWRAKNPEKVIAQKIRFKLNNPDYYKNHKEDSTKMKIRNKKFRTNNPEYSNNYQKRRRRLDINYKLLCNLRKSLHRSLIGNKTTHTHDYFCCSVEYIWQHLEKQFRDGMTRENYGKIWHVDHIIPLSFFNQNDLTEQKLANHWGNLQPLLVQENLLKSDNVPDRTNFKY